MNILLPHRFKGLGAKMVPSGLLLWLAMQLGYINKILTNTFGPLKGNYEWSSYHLTNIAVAIIGVLSFIFGLYFIAFSKEKIEDEMVQKTRLDSFQFAAFLQIITIILGFLYMIIVGDPGESRMLLFFIALLFIFWMSFIGRFNYILHVKYKQ